MANESTYKQFLRWLSKTGLYRSTVLPAVNRIFFMELTRHTANYSNTTWLGRPIMQSVLDLWTIQETIAQVRPELLIECGTCRGGAAYFYAQLFDLMGDGRVITVDIEKLHDLTHPRIEFIIGSSVDAAVAERIAREARSASGPVMVILDSDHSAPHVSRELELYCGLVTPNSYLLVQDGSIDTSPIFQEARPGPLPAIREFLRRHPEYVVDRERVDRFLITHHPDGWLKKIK
jgi:cephalosporin hydroxylase